MALGIFKTRNILVAAVILIAFAVLLPAGYAQRGAPAGPPPTPRASAPFDVTGAWVSLITEDWRVRMVTPKKGDYESVPISAEGRRVADAWDPARDEAAGEQCKAYGAAAVMRIPGRIRIAWENDTTLKVDTEAGTQTRRFVFGTAQVAAGQPSWQGSSVANWENLAGGRGGQPRTGTLKAVTRNLRPGYLRKNGVPYSANTVVTEWYDLVSTSAGELLVVNTEVVDPQNLNQPFVTSTHFRKLPDGSAFAPGPCSAR
jgi:hypothetical protein